MKERLTLLRQQAHALRQLELADSLKTRIERACRHADAAEHLLLHHDSTSLLQAVAQMKLAASVLESVARALSAPVEAHLNGHDAANTVINQHSTN
jgi:hypothetical protein